MATSGVDSGKASDYKKVAGIVLWQAVIMFVALMVWNMEMTQFMKIMLVTLSSITVFVIPIFLVISLK